MTYWKLTLYPSYGRQLAFGELGECGSTVEVSGHNIFFEAFHEIYQQRTMRGGLQY